MMGVATIVFTSRRRRSRHSHPDRSQGGVREAAISSKRLRGRVCYPGMFSPTKSELHREKAELLEDARLQKGLEFLLGRYFSPGGCGSCPVSCPLDEQ